METSFQPVHDFPLNLTKRILQKSVLKGTLAGNRMLCSKMSMRLSETPSTTRTAAAVSHSGQSFPRGMVGSCLAAPQA